MFRWFAERAARREAAEKIYDSIVAQSRNPVFYVRCGVPDTLSGRFDMLVIHMFIVMQNLKLGANEGLVMVAEPPDALDRYFAGEEARWRKVIQDAGIKSE